MSREVCGICWCPYDEDTGECACAPEPNALLPRKPLTKKEIDSIWDSEKAFADIYAIVRAIERAHGIGGQP